MFQVVRDHIHAWEAHDCSPRVLSWIRDGVIPKFATLPRCHDKGNTVLTGAELEVWERTRDEYLQRGAVSVIPASEAACIDNTFFVPKRDCADYRMIHDLRPVNAFCHEYPTSFDTLYSLAEVLLPEDWLVSFDLRHGYFCLSLHPKFRKYFCFRVNGVVYQWNVLPFGWVGSPATFQEFALEVTKVLIKVLKGKARGRTYLDDFMFMFRGYQTAKTAVPVMQATLTALGLEWHPRKSDWEPSMMKRHLGLLVDTMNRRFIAPTDRLLIIKNAIRQLLGVASKGKRWVPVRMVARAVGHMICIILACNKVRMLTRSLYDCIKAALSWEGKVRLSHQAMKDLKAMLKEVQNHKGAYIWPPAPTHVLYTDASESGWGAVLGTFEAQGHWMHYQKHLHIGALEIMAVYFGLLAFRRQLKGAVVQVKVDNQNAYHNLHRWVSSVPIYMRYLRKIMKLSEQHDFLIIPKWVPSEQNVADSLSRHVSKEEWKMERTYFLRMQQLYGPHTIDRFASHTSSQLPLYNSAKYDTFTAGVDAFAQADWESHNNWINPPFSMLSRVVNRLVHMTKCRTTICVPQWPTAKWYRPLIKRAKAVHVVPAGTFAFCRVHSGQQEDRFAFKWPTLLIRLEW